MPNPGSRVQNGGKTSTQRSKQSQKKVPETDAIFDNIKAKDMGYERRDVKRLSLDCKATINLGEFARGGKRGVRIRL